MSRKSDLKKAIQESEEEIETLEKKRIRSQSALLEAFPRIYVAYRTRAREFAPFV